MLCSSRRLKAYMFAIILGARRNLFVIFRNVTCDMKLEARTVCTKPFPIFYVTLLDLLYKTLFLMSVWSFQKSSELVKACTYILPAGHPILPIFAFTRCVRAAPFVSLATIPDWKFFPAFTLVVLRASLLKLTKLVHIDHLFHIFKQNLFMCSRPLLLLLKSSCRELFSWKFDSGLVRPSRYVNDMFNTSRCNQIETNWKAKQSILDFLLHFQRLIGSSRSSTAFLLIDVSFTAVDCTSTIWILLYFSSKQFNVPYSFQTQYWSYLDHSQHNWRGGHQAAQDRGRM